MMERKLAEQEVNIEQATKQAEEVEIEEEKISERLQPTQKELEAITQARQEDLQALNDRLQQQLIETKEEQEKSGT